jgi:uncharacterized protein YegP (UPF0339 family)
VTPTERAAAPGPGRERRREPADGHFRRMGDPGSALRGRRLDALGATPCRFEVYRADEVRTTSTHFSGGDWHWRLCDGAGQTLVDAGGYHNEKACRSAIAILKDRAANATVRAGP